MAANEIRIIVGGDVAGLERASQRGSVALNLLGDAAENVGTSLAQVAPSAQKAAQGVERFKAGLRADPTGQVSILNTGNAFKNIGTNSRDAAAGVRSFSNASSAGNAAILDFSRVIQDLPFGLIGIVNNITQIPGTLQRLSVAARESGKSMASLLFSSATGFGGIGLALSAITTGLLIFQNGVAGFGSASKKAKEDADELAKTIRSIGDIQAEATGGVQGQIAQVNSLAAAISDSTRPYEERRRALQELKGINKAYFDELQLEDAATGKLTKTIGEYNKALVANAIVKAFVEEITEVSKAALKADTDLVKATTSLAQAEKALQTARASARPTGREGTAQTFEEAKANEALIDAFKEQRSQREKLLELETQRAVLFDRLNKAQTDALQFKSTETKSSEKEVDLLAKRLAALEKIKDLTKDIVTLTDLEEEIFDLKVKITLRDAAKNGLDKVETDLAIAGFKKQLDEAFTREVLEFESIPKVKVTSVELATLPTGEIESRIAKAVGLDKNIPIETDRQVLIRLKGIDFVNAQDEAKKAVERLRETIVNGAVDTLSAASTAFGEVLSGIFSGGIGDALAKGAQTLLSGIGGVLQEIGKQIIATSTLIKTLKTALENLIKNPIAGIAVGIGLVALGGLLKNIKIPGFAGGVNNFAGGLAVVGEQGPELVNLPRGSSVIPNHMIGGAQAIILQPSLRVQGKEIIVMLQQVIDSNRSMGGAIL